MSKNKIYIKIDNNYGIVCISDNLRTVEFRAHKHTLTDRARDISNTVEWEYYETDPVLVERNKTGNGCTVYGETTTSMDDMRKIIGFYLKKNTTTESWYILKINGEEYAKSRQEMESKIMGPLNTERTILMSDEDIEYKRDRRIYLP